METIRILQDTYERLYAITPSIADLLEKATVPNFHNRCNKILSRYDKFKKKDEWSYFIEIDLYYLLVLLRENWDELRKYSSNNFFTENNRKLFFVDSNYSIQKIRNEISHPENWTYEMDVYKKWKESIERAAIALGTTIEIELEKLHYQEKQKLLNYIIENVIEPALNKPEIEDSIKELVKETRERLKAQSTAAGIIYFFQDALRASSGQNIGKTLESHGLNSFEKIQDDILDSYFGLK